MHFFSNLHLEAQSLSLSIPDSSAKQFLDNDFVHGASFPPQCGTRFTHSFFVIGCDTLESQTQSDIDKIHSKQQMTTDLGIDFMVNSSLNQNMHAVLYSRRKLDSRKKAIIFDQLDFQAKHRNCAHWLTQANRLEQKILNEYRIASEHKDIDFAEFSARQHNLIIKSEKGIKSQQTIPSNTFGDKEIATFGDKEIVRYNPRVICAEDLMVCQDDGLMVCQVQEQDNIALRRRSTLTSVSHTTHDESEHSTFFWAPDGLKFNEFFAASLHTH
jgi:hypothetical protein